MRNIIDSTGITVIGDQGEIVIVSASDPQYQTIRTYLVSGGITDFDQVRALAEEGKAEIRSAVATVRQVVDGDAAQPYRIIHGDPVDSVVLAAATRAKREGGDLNALGAFTHRLERNPSAASRSQLFAWLAAGGFTLTSDGLIVGYKGVTSDGRSISTGREPVTIRHQSGRVETVEGQVPYPIGATVSMPRHLVDDDRDSECSVGLHVGTYAYAKGFGSGTILVLVDPADVVAVPRRSGGQKMRVCKLTVAAKHDGSQVDAAIFDNVLTVPDYAAQQAYQERPENHVECEDDYPDDEYEGDYGDEDDYQR